MVLINLGALSDSELRYIAQQEGFGDWKDADRDDLIERLQEKYEEEDNPVPETKGSGTARRYLTSLTDFGMEASSSDELPGVEKLPEDYNSTSVHLLIRDPQWAYVYWSVAPAVRETLDDKDGCGLFLRVQQQPEGTGSPVVFDIEVGLNDNEWNINLSDSSGLYTILLCYRRADGTIQQLAASGSVAMYRPYWADHYEEIGAEADLFNIYFSSLVTRSGEPVDNQIIRNIARIFTEGESHAKN